MEIDLRHRSKLLAVLLGIGIAFGTSTANAQDASSGGFGLGELVIGAKVGFNSNSFSQPGTTTGVSAGGFIRSQLLDFLEVQGEIIYSLQGGGRMDYIRDFSLNFGGGSGGSGGSIDGPIDYIEHVNRSILLNVVEVPISVRLGIPEFNGGAIVPRLILGGSYSYNFAAIEISDKIINFVDGTRGLVSNTTENVSDNYFPHNFSAHAGIALDFNLAEAKVFTVEFRYRRGFQNLNQVETNITELTDRLFSSGFSINFSYRLF